MSAGSNKTRAAIVLGIALVAMIVIFAVTVGIGEAGVPDGDVAVVEDTNVTAEAAGIEDGKISQEAFDRALDQAAKRQGLQQTPAPDSPQYSALRDQALGDLLDIVWIKGEAEDRGISVSDREVQQQFQQTKNQSFKSEADYQNFLKQSGFTQADVDLRIELQLLSQKIQQEVADSATKASDDDAQKYYDANESQYQQPEQRDVRVIVNKDKAKIEDALAKLQADDSDASWKAVAAADSTDPTSRTQGGLKRSVTQGTLPPQVDSQVFSADTGQIVGPIDTPTGSYIFEVASVQEASTQPFGDVKDQIKQQLTGQLQQEYFADFLNDYRDHWINLTVCAEDYLMERCDNFTPPPTACTADQAKQTGCPPPVLSSTPGPVGGFLPFTQASGQPQRPHPAGAEQAIPAAPGGIPGAVPGGVPGAAPPGAAPPGAAPPGG